MTALYTLALPGEQTRDAGQEVVLATDKQTSQVLFYQVGDYENDFGSLIFYRDLGTRLTTFQLSCSNTTRSSN